MLKRLRYDLVFHFVRRSALPLIVLLMLSACATNPVTGSREFAMSEEWELSAGKQFHQQLMKQYKVYEDPELQAYVERIGETLASNSHRKDLIFHFTLLDSPQVNAFAVPGGYVYITRGIMAYMTKESHLAGVIGHEIGHVTARHSAQRAAQSQLAGVAGIAAAVATGSRAAADLSNVLSTAIISGYGRNQELQSDRLGAEYIAKNGYDPEDMIEVIGILKNQELFERARAKKEGRQPRAYHGLFATHPRNDKRLQEVIAAAQKYQASVSPGVSAARDKEFLRLTHGMTYGDSQVEGIARGNKFYHQELDMFVEFPKGWRIKNLPNAIQSISPDNKQAIIVQMDNLSKREDAESYLRGKFNNFRDGRPLSTNEDQAFAGVASVNSGRGAKENVRVSAVYRGKRAFVVFGRGTSTLPNRPYFDTVSSIRRLKDSEKSLAKSQRIKVITARKGDTFAKLAAQSSLPQYAEDQLRLINNMYPTGEPLAGQRIKVIE